jgi:hypothetical protein
VRPQLWPATAAKISLLGNPMKSSDVFQSDGVSNDNLPAFAGGTHPGRLMTEVVADMMNPLDC